MTLVRGDKLSPAVRTDVLRRFVHRHLDTTCKGDDQWLAAHAFWVRADGNLSLSKRYAEPAWMADFLAAGTKA